MELNSQHIKSDNKETSNAERKEHALRRWIANKETVCPYAPGEASYYHLPSSLTFDRQGAAYLAGILREFYSKTVEGKPIERLILIPAHDWSNHDDARDYATKAFWCLSMAYHLQTNGGKRQAASMFLKLKNYISSNQEEGIANPVIGKLQNDRTKAPHSKSLFCTAFNPLCYSKSFYRYAPHSTLVLVNARALYLKRSQSHKAMQKISTKVIYGNLLEAMRGELCVDYKDVEREAGLWEQLLFQLYVLNQAGWEKLPPPQLPETLESFDSLQVDAKFTRNIKLLPVMSYLMRMTHCAPREILRSAFRPNGLYATPLYFV
ncbi:MAG: hypothetical protein MK096_10715 [Oleiphilaceae bacterium]|nr:hypothetical protein [Oleiphilaceae bacterium]